MALQFRLKPGVEQRHEGEDLLLADQGGARLVCLGTGERAGVCGG